uniref:ferroxidase n=1 Tax=Cairina moschata TaxID=8855 RepID=A0A8C3CGB1_CAIMO
MTLHCMCLFVLLLLGSWWPDSGKNVVGAAKIREHYIAAQTVIWTYKPEPEEKSRLVHSDPVFKKISYREYEVDFKKEKPANKSAGLLGPTLRAEVGDTLVVHFKNMADKPVSIHPQGLVYNKKAEGSLYDDRTSSVEKQDDAVLPGQVYTYVWEITEEVGPREADLPCLTYAYYSHENVAMDFNSGLIGALLICRKGSLNEDGSQKLFDKEYVLMFGVFDENKSWQRSSSLKYTINGYANGTLPDLEACAYDNISWHLIGMSSKPEIFSIHINGQAMEQKHHRISTVNLVGGASTTVNMTVSEEGRWLISSLVQKHLQAGMHGYLTIRDCGDKEAKKSRLSYKERRMVKNWEYFIAAEEITWDYAPNIPDSLDRHYKAQHLDNFSNLIGKKYKKAIFRQYTDGTFTKRLENPRPKETGILGPTIRAQLNDKVKIVFKNKASRPYSIYFHGVTLSKNAEGANYPLDPTSNDTQSKGIQPGKTYTYEWQIAKTDQPTARDAQCITRLYHSAVDIERDIASGLIGPLLICKSEALTQKGVQKKADGEQHAMFAVFDENKSWYIEDNIKEYCSSPATVKRDDPKFYNSNIMHTINGYVSDSSEILGFCQDNVVQWHFSSVGTHDDIVSVRLSGHAFLYKGKYEDVLNIFPMSGESVTVEMDNVGTWLLASWGAPEKSNGMRLRFRDARCEYEDYSSFEVVDVTYTKTDKKAASTSAEENVGEEAETDDFDDYQEELATRYSIRSSRKSKGNEETQNLTALAWEHYEDAATSSKVAVDSGLKVINTNESTQFLESHTTPLPQVEAETFQSNYTSVTAEKDLFLASISDGKPDLVSENRSQSSYAIDHSSMSAAEHLLSNGEAQMEVAEEPLTNRKDSKFSSEEHQTESTGKGNDSINSKRKKRSSLAIKFYSIQKMNALLNHVRNKNASSSDKTNAPHSMHHAENTTNITPVGDGQLPSDYDDELEEEEMKVGNDMQAVNLTLELDVFVEGDESNASSLSELELSKDKQAGEYYAEDTSGGEYEYHYVSFDDPYMTDPKLNIKEQRNPESIAEHYLRSRGNERRYYIAAKEVCWNYAGFKKSTMNDKACKDGTTYKVIFQRYTDSTFTTLQDEGEYEEHLGILGPVIRAEVDDVILVHFKNLASRPYSLHAHGLFYEKSSEGSTYDDESTTWFKEDDKVQPNSSYIYVWYANRRSGPLQSGAACRSWVYYSDVNLEKDTHSGLIGPILICQKGTLSMSDNKRTSTRDFFLLFMVFDEEKSWYFDKRSRRSCTEKTQGNQQCHKFYAINGITYNLQGLKMYEGELVRWHLLNMGGPKDIHVVHFHGQTFVEQGEPKYQLGTYTLLPGSFQTIEMKPQRPGWWLLDTEVGEYQQAGMQASYLVLEKECRIPMGLASGLILDSQINASDHLDYWEPKLARLNNSGTYNAWSTTMKDDLPWIQVDFQRQVLLTGIQMQGAKQFLKSLYVQKFFIAYSKDKRKWKTFRGDSFQAQKIFEGNSDANGIKENIIDPPIIAKYIRVYPTQAYNRPTLRMELLGCEVDGCSLPLGMENGAIKNSQITASSVKTSWFNTWDPFLARLNQKGKINAWRAKSNNNQQWLQIDLLSIKKITAVATQGVKSMSSENFVKTYVILYSNEGSEWKSYTDGSNSVAKVFSGNENSDGHVKHFFNPPILSRFIRIVPKTWYHGIALRVELFGCDFDEGLAAKRTEKSGSS